MGNLSGLYIYNLTSYNITRLTEELTRLIKYLTNLLINILKSLLINILILRKISGALGNFNLINNNRLLITEIKYNQIKSNKKFSSG